jgi:hypothetical protein
MSSSCPCSGAKCALTADDARHGKRTAYAKHGCRCDACRDAQAAYQAAYTAANPAVVSAANARHYDRNRDRIRARQNRPGYVPLATRLVEAGALLFDGSGYAEASRSTGVARELLVELVPGRGMPPVERGELARAVVRTRRTDARLVHELRDAA